MQPAIERKSSNASVKFCKSIPETGSGTRTAATGIWCGALFQMQISRKRDERKRERRKEGRKEGRKGNKDYFGRKTKLHEARLFLARVDSCKFLEYIGTRARSSQEITYTSCFASTYVYVYVRVWAVADKSKKERKERKLQSPDVSSTSG